MCQKGERPDLMRRQITITYQFVMYLQIVHRHLIISDVLVELNWFQIIITNSQLKSNRIILNYKWFPKSQFTMEWGLGLVRGFQDLYEECCYVVVPIFPSAFTFCIYILHYIVMLCSVPSFVIGTSDECSEENIFEVSLKLYRRIL